MIFRCHDHKWHGRSRGGLSSAVKFLPFRRQPLAIQVPRWHGLRIKDWGCPKKHGSFSDVEICRLDIDLTWKAKHGDCPIPGYIPQGNEPLADVNCWAARGPELSRSWGAVPRHGPGPFSDRVSRTPCAHLAWPLRQAASAPSPLVPLSPFQRLESESSPSGTSR
jgi:hypothetical protein